MPTLSSEPAKEPHQLRQVAESFGVDAERYDRTRPRYPAALVSRIVAASPGPAVLDVGVGTGIVARQLQAAGCRVLGVEPDERMAEYARRGGVTVEVSTIEAWDPAGRTFDAVVAGQTWHWVDPVAGAAKAAAVLRPGGLLALFWNAGEMPPEIGAAFGDVFERVLPDSLAARAFRQDKSAVDMYALMLAKAAEGIRETGAFGAPEEWRFDWEHTYTRDEYLDQVPTHGLNTQLPADTMRALLAGLGAAIDAIGGSFTMRFSTLASTAERTAPA